MGGGEDDRGGESGGEGFLPAGDAEAPAISGFEAGEAVEGHGGAEIVALGLGEAQKFGGDLGADDVGAAILGAGLAAAIAKEAGDWIGAAGLQGLAEDIFGVVHGENGGERCRFYPSAQRSDCCGKNPVAVNTGSAIRTRCFNGLRASGRRPSRRQSGFLGAG